MITTINEWKMYINEMYFGKGFELEALEDIKKLLPKYTVSFKNNNKDIMIHGNNHLYIIEFGPMPGYNYAKLTTYKNNENIGSVALEKTQDIINHLEE